MAVSTIASSWLLMQVIHETGHVIGALFTGGTVRRVVLVPWELSRTDLTLNPNPLIVCWAGPLFGAIGPVAIWLFARQVRWPGAFWLRFLAGFCLIANGAYIGVGAFSHDGDAGELIREGHTLWTLWLFGATTIPVGFLAWHGLGAEFGFGPNAHPIPWKKALTSLVVCLTIAAIESVCAII